MNAFSIETPVFYQIPGMEIEKKFRYDLELN